MGRDLIVIAVFLALRVSIHAPAWGATASAWATCSRCAAFQFTRPHGARRPPTSFPSGRYASFQFTRPHGARPRRRSCARSATACFNSRARMGRDVRPLLAVLADDDVSIHAPAWGATILGESTFIMRSVSIHAPAWGATSVSAAAGCMPRFQFTRPHGARLAPTSSSLRPAAVSIHAPAWGATLADVEDFLLHSVSIHAPAWGATESGGRNVRQYVVSIHAPAWGATLRLPNSFSPT